MVTEWKNKKIGDILDFKNGLNKSKEFFGYGTPIVNYTDVYHHSGLLAEDIKGKVSLSQDEIKRFEVRKGDVFFTRTSETPEEVGISSVLLEDIDDCVFSGFVLRGRPKNDALAPEYCKYCFSTKAVRAEIVKNCTYTTRALTNGRVLSAIEISVPEKEEQKEIANILTLMEEHIANLSELIEKKKAIRDGVIEDLITGNTRLSGFAGQWETMKLLDCGKFVSGNGFPLAYQGKAIGDYPFYKVSDLSRIGNEYCMNKANHYITREVADVLSCNIIPANSIIFAKIGAAIFLERKRITVCDCCIDNNMMSLQPRNDISNRFLWLAMQRIVFGEYVQTTALPSLSGRVLGNIEIFVPQNMDEQNAIADVIEAMNEEIANIQDEKNKMIQIREGAMDDLLMGQIRLTK